ncbi:MAG: hypothetical protein ACP5PV_03015 [Methanothrix sp.]
MILAERGIERSFCRLSIFSLPRSLLPGDLQGLSAGNGVRHVLGVAHHHGVGSLRPAVRPNSFCSGW